MVALLWLSWKLDGNCTRILLTVFNKSWKRHPKNSISQSIQEKHARHCCRSKGKLINNVFLWTPIYGQPIYIYQACMDTRGRLEDSPRALTDRNAWWEKIKRMCCWHALMMMAANLNKIFLLSFHYLIRMYCDGKDKGYKFKYCQNFILYS